MIVATKAFARGCVCLLTGLLSLNAQGEGSKEVNCPQGIEYALQLDEHVQHSVHRYRFSE